MHDSANMKVVKYQCANLGPIYETDMHWLDLMNYASMFTIVTCGTGHNRRHEQVSQQRFLCHNQT